MRIALLILTGFISLLCQVVVLRELAVAFYGVELIYILSIGLWMLWTAAGVMLGRRLRVAGLNRIIAWLYVFSVLLPLNLMLIRGLRRLFLGIPGAFLPLNDQLLALCLALAPAGIVLGLCFQWAAQLYIQSGRSLAQAYALESIGGLLGGMSATLLLRTGVQNLVIALLCSLVVIIFIPLISRTLRIFVTTLILWAGLGVTLFYSGVIDHWLTSWNHPLLIESRDSPYGRITVDGTADYRVFYENDALVYDTESSLREELVHLTMIQRDTLVRILLLGGGVTGIFQEVLKYDITTCDYVELNPVLLELSRKYSPEPAGPAGRRARVDTIVTDPRRFLPTAPVYDMIIIGAGDPSSGQSNRFYTREMFDLCSRHLAPGGVVAVQLRASENIQTAIRNLRTASIYRALATAFPEIIIIPGSSLLMLVSQHPFRQDGDRLAERLADRGIENRLVTPRYIQYLYTNDRFAYMNSLIPAVDSPVNADTRPITFEYTTLLWLVKFFPRLLSWEPGPVNHAVRNRIAGGLLFGLYLAVIWILRKRDLSRRVMMVILAGFCGMVLESVLILYYQVKWGVLYLNIGILLMLFMAGLAAGAYVSWKLCSGPAVYSHHRVRITGVVLVIGFTAMCLLLAGWLHFSRLPGLLPVGVFQFLCGACVSGVFAVAGQGSARDQHSLVAPLYAADLLGGCAGSILTAGWLIPFGGLEMSVMSMAFLSVMALFLL